MGFLWVVRLEAHRVFATGVYVALAVAGSGSLVIAASIYLLMRPRALVPPPLRAARGALTVGHDVQPPAG
jgi:hypothetical protein